MKNVGRKGREGGEREVMTQGGVKDEGFRRWVVRGQPRGEERRGKTGGGIRGERNIRGQLGSYTQVVRNRGLWTCNINIHTLERKRII